MTTLAATAVGNAVAPNGFQSAPNGALTLIGAGTQDDAWAYQNTNTTGSYDQGYLLADMPTGFGTMSSLSFRIRYAAAAAQTNFWNALAVRIVNNTSGAVLAAADSGGTFKTAATDITTTTPTPTASIAFDYVDTAADKASWDDARVEIRITMAKNMAGDTVERRVYAFEVTGEWDEPPLEGARPYWGLRIH